MAVSTGVAGMISQCQSLSGGMTVLGWPAAASPTSIAGAVMTAANEFHLSYHRLANAELNADANVSAAPAPAGPGKLWSHGVSGEIDAVPKGFTGQTMLYYSPKGTVRSTQYQQTDGTLSDDFGRFLR